MPGLENGYSATLFQNHNQSVMLLDIPSSIAFAQQGSRKLEGEVPSLERQLLSMPPTQAPYPSTDPKSQSATPAPHPLPFPKELLKDALDNISAHMADQPWCLTRQPIDSSDKPVEDGPSLVTAVDSPKWSMLGPLEMPVKGASYAIDEIQNRPVLNAHPSQNLLHIRPGRDEYHVPPGCGFMMSTISPSTVISFSMAALIEYPNASSVTAAGPGQFDLIVLDPPWPNRSVRRSRQYREMDAQCDPLSALAATLGQHIAPDGLVACWNTNKESVGNQTLDLFADWGVELIEEWAWLKVTKSGQTVTKLDSFWRKPYELLLVGRRSSEGTMRGSKAVVKRVIAAVPDLHSRKPNLKALMEQCFFDNCSSYRALEIFARNLTAGWWAWGDDVLKFNNVRAWGKLKQGT